MFVNVYMVQIAYSRSGIAVLTKNSEDHALKLFDRK